eukprot:129503_1
MHALRRMTSSQPIPTATIHRQMSRHFSNPKSIPQLSRRQRINIKIDERRSTAHTTDTMESTTSIEMGEEDCALSNPFYSRLLNSKLDSCPLQPFNEQTNILWGAVYDIAQRRRVEGMSRWEQIQRGYARPELVSNATQYEERRTLNHKYSKHEEEYRFGEMIVDVNDILQMHYSLQDIVTNNDATQPSVTLAKATGSLDKLLASQHGILMQESEERDTMEMRNDLKWKKRQMKLHIKKKRRDRERMKKK